MSKLDRGQERSTIDPRVDSGLLHSREWTSEQQGAYQADQVQVHEGHIMDDHMVGEVQESPRCDKGLIVAPY